ncbi:MAG TPA: tRNA (N6-isopentenyl adenosine(37)-C2)-methylthiotransferase MiaB [Anaerolineales bacterium]|nr:tRNA (N6-isopentenyl adenosine(37)-C2)-methylthiotransferase MiaB [Anaerolineales bacterium]
MRSYFIQTWGCQMNTADSQRVSSALEKIGYLPADSVESADVIVLNTCVVRQQAEDAAIGRLTTLAPLKKKKPEVVVNLMGCMVGIKGGERLKQVFPLVDVFSPPSEPGPLVQYLAERDGLSLVEAEAARRFALQDEMTTVLNPQSDGFSLPVAERGQLVSAHVPVVFGCSHACTFCIIPFRRGVERSRPVGEIAAEARALAAQGVKEVTLLGQIVDRYGKDIPDGPSLAQLLRAINDVDGIERIRFLTSHPNYMTDELLDAVAELPKVCEHIEAPVQAGDDEVLANMKRGYTNEDYRRLVERIRQRIPNVSIATDVIVGFPGETEAQFQKTYDLLADLKLDVAHLARYSPRPGTVSARRMEDDVPDEEKRRRHQALEDLQAEVGGEINARLLGQTEEILVEENHKGKWKGRTRTNKIVFFEDEGEWKGRLANVTITKTGPWSMQGELVG